VVRRLRLLTTTPWFDHLAAVIDDLDWTAVADRGSSAGVPTWLAAMPYPSSLS
jgi:hypothetical protein